MRSHPPAHSATPPTTHAVAAPEKARPQHLATAVTASIKWPGPLPSKEDPRAARAPGSDKTDPRRVRLPISGLEACSKLTSATGALDLRSLLISGSRAGAADNPRNTHMRKDGSTQVLPCTALLIRGSKPDPRRVRTGAPDHQSQGRQGRAHSSLSSSPPARGRPTCCVREPARAASRGDPTEGELPRQTRASALDESPDHEPTLIERGMGVHLNHPPTARRGIHNPRPNRWGLWRPHPPSVEGRRGCVSNKTKSSP
jgi:hypothetical protein